MAGTTLTKRHRKRVGQIKRIVKAGRRDLKQTIKKGNSHAFA